MRSALCKNLLWVFILCFSLTAKGQNIPCLWPYETLQTEKVAGQQPYFPTRHFRDTVLVFTVVDTVAHTSRTHTQFKRSTMEEFKRLLQDLYLSREHLIPQLKITQKLKIEVDSFRLFNWYSPQLANFREKILYNGYSGKEIYRLYWSRALTTSILIRLEHSDKGNWIITKNLKAEKIKYRTIQKDGQSVTIVKKIRQPKRLKIYTKTPITEAQYQRFLFLLDSTQTLCTAPLEEKGLSGDGESYTLEVHRPEGYRFCTRHNPDYLGQFTYLRKAGDYLISLSAVKNYRH